MMVPRRERRIGIILVLWGFLWRSVVWYTSAGALLGGMYGCAVVVSAFFTPGLEADGWVWAFPIGAILGGAYGLAVGLVNGVLTAIATCALFSPLGEPPKHRRVIVVTSMLGVLVVPGYWSVGFVGSRDYEGFGELTGSFWGDVLIYAGFPTLVLVFVSRWLGSRIAGWYERESARAIAGEAVELPLVRVL